jgi:hypothetical protein
LTYSSKLTSVGVDIFFETLHTLYLYDTFGSHIAAHVCTHAHENSINGCDLVLEEAHCHMFLVSSQFGRMLTYSRILIF